MPVIKTRPLLKTDWPKISEIYLEGIQTKMATFETEMPTWEHWDSKYLLNCRLVAETTGKVIGFIVLSPTSKRKVYNGVAEVSLYVSKAYRGQKVGEQLLSKLISNSEEQGFWTLQASIFSKNKASINLFLKCGFRIVGLREKIGKLDQKWYDNYLLERRSTVI